MGSWAGVTFTHQLSALDSGDDSLRYYSDTPQVIVNEITGKMSFTPSDAGYFPFEVCVEDRFMSKDCRTAVVVVET